MAHSEVERAPRRRGFTLTQRIKKDAEASGISILMLTSAGHPEEVDRQVPLVFMGPGIPHGRSDQRARTVDVAPSLARLAGIPAPQGLDGHPLILNSPR